MVMSVCVSIRFYCGLATGCGCLMYITLEHVYFVMLIFSVLRCYQWLQVKQYYSDLYAEQTTSVPIRESNQVSDISRVGERTKNRKGQRNDDNDDKRTVWRMTSKPLLLSFSKRAFH